MKTWRQEWPGNDAPLVSWNILTDKYYLMAVRLYAFSTMCSEAQVATDLGLFSAFLLSLSCASHHQI